MRYIKFDDDDRDYSSCSEVWKPTKGYERIVSIDVRRMRWKDQEFILEFLRAHGIVADYNEWLGYIEVLPDRKDACRVNDECKHEDSGRRCLVAHSDGCQCKQCSICGKWYR